MKGTSIHIICKSLKKAFQWAQLTLLVLLVTIGVQTTSSGQQFPVRVNTFITPPYSIYLSDYTAPESNSLTVMLSLRDLDRPQYQTKLRIKLEGSNGITIQTIPGYTPPPIVLSGGITETLTGYDLRNYLNPDNLEFEGITRADFIRSGTLPEGFYTLTVEALDYNRNVVVSNSGMANAWFVLNDPPLINLPFDGEKVRVTDPQNVMFSWTPRHTASPNAAFNTEYEFKLVEIYPEGRNPNDAILASNSIYQTTTTTTSLNYSIIEPLLIPGRTYAFRIRAYDIDGRDLFKNQGYSEVYTFKFGEACKAPENVTGEAPDPDRMKVSWDTQNNHTEYVLRHRKQGSSEWFTEETFLDAVMVPGLETSSAYEYQVQARCEFQESEFSPIEKVTTPEIDEDEFACGSDFVPVDISTSPLLVPLLPAMTIKTADFRIIIKEAKQNQDGTYAGTGWAMIPWFELATVRVKFNNIRINSQLEVFDGRIVTVYSNNSRFVLEDDTPLSEAGTTGDSDSEDFTDPVDDFFDGYDFIDTVEVDYDITDVTTNDDGDIVITYEDANGDLQEEIIDIDDDESGDILVTDESGNSWAVDENGDVSESPANEPDPISDPAQVDYIVQFTPSANQSYGFDYKTFNGGEYDELTIQEEDYTVAYKSVESARTDIVTAVTSRAEFPTEVGFKSQDGLVTSSPGQNNNEKQISINGKYAGYEETIDAYVNIEADGEDEELLVGRLNVVTYDKVSPRVVIVPVNGVTPPNAEEIANTLNGIYKQAVVEWHVRVEETYEVNQNTISGLTDGQSGMVSSYTPNMRSFNQAFRDNGPQMDDNAFYLFLVSGADAGLGGFMPFKRQFGYIFTDELDNYTLEKAIAHELGHGAFRLRHTFSPEDFKANQNSTDNLMDYAGGTQLKKYQWDLIHSPENMNGWFEEDSEGALDEAEEFGALAKIEELLSDSYVTIVDINDSEIDLATHGFPLPSGLAVEFTELSKIVLDHRGGLYGFQLQNGDYYSAIRIKDTQRVVGYINRDAEYTPKINGGEFLSEHFEYIRMFRYELVELKTGKTVYTKVKDQIDQSTVLGNCECTYTWTYEGSNKGFYDPIEAILVPSENEFLGCTGSDCQQVEGVASGMAMNFFLEVQKLTDNYNENELVDLANYLDNLLEDKKYRFYGDGLEAFAGGSNIAPFIMEYIVENNLLSIDKFTGSSGFPHIIDKNRDDYIIVSKIDLWEDIPENYNENSLDFKRNTTYQYSGQDLIVRQHYKSLGDNVYLDALYEMEKDGMATPLSQFDVHEQYVACFKTNSAIFAWTSYFANTVADIVEVGAAYQVVRMTTAFLKSAKSTKKSWLKKLIDYIRSKIDLSALENLISKIDNLNLKNLANSLKSGDNLIIKKSAAGEKISINTFHGRDFTEIAVIEDNALILRHEQVLDDGAEIVSSQKIADDIEVRRPNGEVIDGEVEYIVDDSGRGWFRVKSGKWSNFPNVSKLSPEALIHIDNWSETLITKLDNALERYPGIHSEIIENTQLLDEFSLFGTNWEGKYGVKMNFIDGLVSGPEFQKMIDDVIPTLKNGKQPQNIQDLGRVFDQEYAIEAEIAFRNGTFEKLPHLETYYDDGYEIVSGQVRIKSGVNSNVTVEVRPDVLLFKTNTLGEIVTSSSIWKECKIRSSSPPTGNQATVFDLLKNNTVSKNELEFEVLSNNATLVNLGLPKGSTMGFEKINQVSIKDGNFDIISIY